MTIQSRIERLEDEARNDPEPVPFVTPRERVEWLASYPAWVGSQLDAIADDPDLVQDTAAAVRRGGLPGQPFFARAVADARRALEEWERRDPAAAAGEWSADGTKKHLTPWPADLDFNERWARNMVLAFEAGEATDDRAEAVAARDWFREHADEFRDVEMNDRIECPDGTRASVFGLRLALDGAVLDGGNTGWRGVEIVRQLRRLYEGHPPGPEPDDDPDPPPEPDEPVVTDPGRYEREPVRPRPTPPAEPPSWRAARDGRCGRQGGTNGRPH